MLALPLKSHLFQLVCVFLALPLSLDRLRVKCHSILGVRFFVSFVIRWRSSLSLLIIVFVRFARALVSFEVLRR